MSSVRIGRTDTPGVSAGTRNWASPPLPGSSSPSVTSRAVTRNRSAWPADSTGALCPVSTYCPLLCPLLGRAATPTAPSRSNGRGSAYAQLPIRSPVIRPGSSSAFCCAVPDRATAAVTTLAVVSGPGAAYRPNSNATRARSTQALAADAAAAVGLGYQQRRPAQVGALAPEVAAEAGRVAAQLAQQRGRDLVVQELARRPGEERLLRGSDRASLPALLAAARARSTR